MVSYAKLLYNHLMFLYLTLGEKIMKKAVSFLIITIIICIISMCLPYSAAESENLLGKNSDPATFDEMTTNQSAKNKWIYWIEDTKFISYSIVDEVRADGKSGKVCQSDHYDWGSSYIKFIIPAEKLEKNTRYQFSAMVKVNSDVYWAGASQGSWITANVPGATKCTPLGLQDKDTWKLIKTEFLTPSQVKDVTVAWHFEATAGKSWAYDFKVTKVELPVYSSQQSSQPSSQPSQSSQSSSYVSSSASSITSRLPNSSEDNQSESLPTQNSSNDQSSEELLSSDLTSDDGNNIVSIETNSDTDAFAKSEFKTGIIIVVSVFIGLLIGGGGALLYFLYFKKIIKQ